jgi:hypothetical protein
VCGLCFDRKAAEVRYQAYLRTTKDPVEFDEWYDKNA